MLLALVGILSLMFLASTIALIVVDVPLEELHLRISQ